MQAFSKISRLRPCPPHGPFLMFAVKESSYVAQCVACRLQGPERKVSAEAKQAFEEAWTQG